MPLVSFLSRLSPLGRAALGFAVASLVLAILLQGSPRFSNASQPGGRMPPALAIQFAGTVEDVELILGEAPSPDREVMRFKLYLDFVFIPAYCGLLVTLGLLARAGSGWSRIAGSAAALCAVAGGVFDVLENRATLAIVDTSLQATSQPMIDAVRSAAATKWIVLALSVIFLSSHYVRRWLAKPKP